MRLRQQTHGFTSSLTALLATTDTPLGGLEFAFGSPQEARVLDGLAIGEGGEVLQSHIYADLLTCWWQRSRFDLVG
jgi:hypothetical protein